MELEARVAHGANPRCTILSYNYRNTLLKLDIVGVALWNSRF
jgi:hypothetical protein